jgi:hypothetical protein
VLVEFKKNPKVKFLGISAIVQPNDVDVFNGDNVEAYDGCHILAREGDQRSNVSDVRICLNAVSKTKRSIFLKRNFIFNDLSRQ